MKKIVSVVGVLSICFFIYSCKKNSDIVSPDNSVTEEQVLNDFAEFVAIPNYQDIQEKAAQLNTAVETLNSDQTDQNLDIAKNAWYQVRQAWEQCEGFLFGPVEDFNFDPVMDDWPVNRIDLDSLLASNNPLTLSDIDALPTSLKGFHPIEYILFGIAGSRKAADLSEQEMKYVVSLTQSLYNTTAALRESWDPNYQDFTSQLITAGNGSQRYATRKDAFIAIVTSMAGICEEVAGGKMQDPLIAQDSTLEESQFSHNSTSDFKNNITGILNAYLGKYKSDGYGINELVVASNISLDQKIQSQINTAISSFDNINKNYGAAIYSQQMQIRNTQTAIQTLQTTLEDDLINFIQTNIRD